MALSVTPLDIRSGEIQEANGFPRFDVASHPSDHHYLFTSSGAPDAVVSKKIMQEWRILERNLPDTIFVRVFETRMELLRAAIVGAAGTPYHDGLFFFDLAFPPDYPTRPPLVYFRSYGLRLNPNLYANGRVCVSLLNTWAGKKCEKWDPSQSTVLQVLLSIQALVLNEKPYFNEPGHGMWPAGEKKSNAYNEDVFVLTCKTMLFQLRRPPKQFEAFVLGHYNERGRRILDACEAYTDGLVRVGDYGFDWSGSRMAETSQKFKASMHLLVPELISTFLMNEIPLGDFVERWESKQNAASFHNLARKKEKKGIARKVIIKLKEVLGLKKKKKKDSIRKKSS